MKKNKGNADNLAAEIQESLGDGTLKSKAPNLEKRIIGICFNRPSELQVITNSLQAEDFSDPRYKVFFNYIKLVYASGKLPDREVCLTTANRSSEFEIEEDDYQAAMDAAVQSEGDLDIEQACHQLHDLFVVRRMLGFAGKVTANIAEGKTSYEIVGQAEEFIKQVSGHILVTDTLDDIDSLLKKTPRGIAELTDPPKDGVKTPIPELNDYLYGFRPGQFYILGARPSVGKSSLLAQFAGYAAGNQNCDTFIFSHEMSSWDFWARLCCQVGIVRSNDILHGTLTDEEKSVINDYIKNKAPRNLFISDLGGKTPLSLRSELARIKARRGAVGLVCIDYLQLMNAHGRYENRNQEVSAISRSLKLLSKEFNCRVIAAAQLSRQSENRQGTDGRPQLSDLRDSGSLEQDADVVMFLHRPSLNWKGKNGGPPPDDEIIVAKQRRGRTGIIKCKYQGEYYRFVGVN